jgi:hypothetical protein
MQFNLSPDNFFDTLTHEEPFQTKLQNYCESVAQCKHPNTCPNVRNINENFCSQEEKESFHLLIMSSKSHVNDLPQILSTYWLFFVYKNNIDDEKLCNYWQMLQDMKSYDNVVKIVEKIRNTQLLDEITNLYELHVVDTKYSIKDSLNDVFSDIFSELYFLSSFDAFVFAMNHFKSSLIQFVQQNYSLEIMNSEMSFDNLMNMYMFVYQTSIENYQDDTFENLENKLFVTELDEFQYFIHKNAQFLCEKHICPNNSMYSNIKYDLNVSSNSKEWTNIAINEKTYQLILMSLEFCKEHSYSVLEPQCFDYTIHRDKICIPHSTKCTKLVPLNFSTREHLPLDVVCQVFTCCCMRQLLFMNFTNIMITEDMSRVFLIFNDGIPRFEDETFNEMFSDDILSIKNFFEYQLAETDHYIYFFQFHEEFILEMTTMLSSLFHNLVEQYNFVPNDNVRKIFVQKIHSFVQKGEKQKLQLSKNNDLSMNKKCQNILRQYFSRRRKTRT